MSADPTESYRQALRALDQATAEVEAVVAVVCEAADNLKDWRRVIVPNTAPGYGPRAVVPLCSPFGWPTMGRLDSLLRAWHRAAQAARDAWGAVPEAGRTGLRSPPA